MADDKEGGTDIFRVIAFGILGAALVIIGFVARGMVDTSDVTDAPSHWLGPTYTGSVVSYTEGESIEVKAEGEDATWTCKIDEGTKLTSATGEALAAGTMVQVKYRGGENPTAKNIRVIKPHDGGEKPADSATPEASGTPATEATPQASGTPAG